MAFNRRAGGGWAAPSIMKRRAGNDWADIQNVYRRENGGWVLVWQAYTPMGASISPNPASAGGVTNPSVGINLSVWNGKPPYSVSWSLSTTGSGGSGTANIVNPSTSSATVSGSANRTSGGYWNGNITATITDQTGRQIQVSGTVNLSMTKAGGIET